MSHKLLPLKMKEEKKTRKLETKCKITIFRHWTTDFTELSKGKCIICTIWPSTIAIYFYLEAIFKNTCPGRRPKLSPAALLYSRKKCQSSGRLRLQKVVRQNSGNKQPGRKRAMKSPHRAPPGSLLKTSSKVVNWMPTQF